MEFTYSQTENFEMEELSSDTGYFKKPVEINRRWDSQILCLSVSKIWPIFDPSSLMRFTEVPLHWARWAVCTFQSFFTSNSKAVESNEMAYVLYTSQLFTKLDFFCHLCTWLSDLYITKICVFLLKYTTTDQEQLL